MWQLREERRSNMCLSKARMKFHLLSVPFLFSLVLCSSFTQSEAKINVAVVGGGIGGTASAYWISQLFGNDVQIDVFEAKKVGGRLSTIIIGGREYESGATLIHPQNMYMVNFTKMFGLHPKDSPQHKLGIFDGDEMRFTGSDWSMVTMAKMFWRYGMSVYNIKSFVDEVLQNFTRIYEHQDKGYSFTTVDSLLRSMDEKFVNYTKHSTRTLLQEHGYSDLFIDELVTGGLRANYGQGVDIHGFVGLVSLAGVLPGLWSVHGGNRQVADKLLQLSKAELIQAEVTHITLFEDDDYGETKYELRYIFNAIKDTDNPVISSKQYDIVIIATPLHRRVTDIIFQDFPSPIKFFPQEFHRTAANFIQGRPNVSEFGFTSLGDFTDLLFTTESGLFYNSMGRNYPIDWTKQEGYKALESDENVYKVFSPEVLDDSQIKKLFFTIRDKGCSDWLAYPHYSSSQEDFPPFVLHDRMYYVNAIEVAASAIEMSLISARNVALLAFSHWKEDYDKINNEDILGETILPVKTEL